MNLYKTLRTTAASVHKNLRGWRTGRKIVVIESDDWGSIRMPSREVYEACLKAGYPVDRISYERYDSLASEEDLEHLFELLSSFKDRNGRHPVITANVLTANPDFEKIEASGFREYANEPIIETFKRYPRHSNCFALWKQGIDSGVFFPQYHGREHLNVSKFMKALQAGDEDVRFGFRHRMPGSIPKGHPPRGNRYVEATRFDSAADKEEKRQIYMEGLDRFEELFGYRSATVIPTNYVWSTDFNEELAEKGIEAIQTNGQLKDPLLPKGEQSRRFQLGEKDGFGIAYLKRNAVFEPSLIKTGTENPPEHCLHQIGIAFAMRKPAILTSHRINYCGFLDEANRDRTLTGLKKLLTEILNKWPDAEFMTSIDLYKAINDNYD